MTLRYDKLYIGNDVFFFNDRTGRVERLHSPLEAGSNNNFSNLMQQNDTNSVSFIYLKPANFVQFLKNSATVYASDKIPTGEVEKHAKENTYALRAIK